MPQRGHWTDRLVPTGHGRADGKYLPGQPRPEGSRGAYGSGISDEYLRDDVLSAVQALVPLAQEAGYTLAQLALAWVLNNDNVSAAIVGATRPEQVTDNAAASGRRLEPDLLARVEEVLASVTVMTPPA